MKKFNVFIVFGLMLLSFLFFRPPSTNFAPVSAQGSAEDTLLIGTTSFGLDLDPQNAWDSASFNIIQQVCEGLYTYDLGDPYLRIVPRLTTDCGTWSDNDLEFTVKLRENVTFHNGHAFNAIAVKKSFDRLNRLIETGILQTTELYKPLNGEFIINDTVILSDYEVRFVLNYPFVPFVELLCGYSSMIVDASVMPTDDIIPPNGTLVGTGPYRFLENNGEKVEFTYYENYYRGVPAVKNCTFIKYESLTAISIALLAGDIDMGDYDPDFLSSFETSEILTVEEQKPGSIITYMGMNNIHIEKSMRQAISYAIDYNFIIEDIYRNFIVRMTSVIPLGIGNHYPQEVATYDVDKARQILIDAELSKGLDEDSADYEWIALAESDIPVASYNYTYNLGNCIREDVGIEAQHDLKQIGIKIELKGVTWIEFFTKLHIYHNELQLFLIDWMPDYNDPSNFINQLFSNTSMSNSAQVNDPWLQEKMMEGIIEFNKTKRCLIYLEIQNYVTTDLMPWIFIGFNNGVSVHSIHVRDLQRNAFGRFYIFPLTWHGENATWNEELYCNHPCGPPVDCRETDNTNNEFLEPIIGVIFGVSLVVFIILIIKKSSIK